MKKIKVMTLVGTRPEIIKLSLVIKELDIVADHILVHSGQNYDYELNEIFFEELGLKKPDYFLSAAGGTSSETVGKVIIKIDELLEKEKPDAFLILGDTNSCMGAYAAKRRKIPIFHMEAGNRCFDMRVPEELNRKLLDHLSDVNLVYSDVTRLNLIQEGLPSDRIIKSGSPTYEVICAHEKEIEASDILEKLNLKPRDYFVLSAHREENIGIDKNFERLLQVVVQIAQEYKKKIVFSVHPRTKKRLDEEGVVLPPEVTMMKPLGLFDYLKLQKNSLCVVSDSGTISEESSMLNFPGINLREAHERLEAMDEGVVIMSGLNPERVMQALELAIKQERGEREFQIPADYQNVNVSKKVVRVIVSYTDYIKRVVWSEVV